MFEALKADMNAKNMIAIAIGLSSLTTTTLIAGPPVVSVQVPTPAVSVQVPVPAPPVVTVQTPAPDTYIWDGYEYVGVVGSQDYYLGPGNVWLTLDAGRSARWHDWERGHADWRNHAVRNERYRHDVRDHDKDRDRDH